MPPRELDEDVVERRAGADAGASGRPATQRRDAAGMHDGEHVAERLGLLHVVRGDQDGRRELAPARAQFVPDGAARDGIEADRGLVEKQDAGRWSIAWAISSLRIMPPEYVRTSAFAAYDSPMNSSASAMRTVRWRPAMS